MSRAAVTRPLSVSLVLSLLALGCAEGELEDPPPHLQPVLLDFESSGCKKEEQALSVLGPGQAPLVSISDFEGLECLEWELDPDPLRLTLRLLNFNHGCVEAWDGRVERGPEGQVDFLLQNDECEVGSCGACLYDMRFDVGDFTYTGGLDVRIGVAPCESESTTATAWHERLTLPLDVAESGILCRHADGTALDEHAVATGRCGAFNMPCGEGSLCSSGTDTGCESGLECVLLGGSDVSRCLQPCEEDDDCEPSPTLACVDGLCQLH